MPWPVTHILTAEIHYEPFFSHLDHKKFIIGTCFPDIRYPAGLPRTSTHANDLTLSEIQSKSAFQAGLAFHSFVDDMWNTFVLRENHHIFDEVPHNKSMIHTMKILQDKYLYSKSEDWSQIATAFEDPIPEEKAYGVSKEMIFQWHQMLKYYLSKPPNFDDLDMLSISLKPEIIDKISQYYLAYQNHDKLYSLLVNFYDQAEHLPQKT